MKNQIEVQLAWKIIEFLEALTDLIGKHYLDDFIDADLMEDLKVQDPSTQ
jgi:hypothetical protein